MFESLIFLIIIYMLLGAVVGFLAGLLGIGGGGLMVPVLTSIFISQGIPLENVLHMALGTSMAAIVITSYSSMRAHTKKENIIWDVWRMLTPGVIIGTFSATFLVSYLSTLPLALFFACFMAFVSIQLFLNKKPKSTRYLKKGLSVFGAAGLIGSISAIVSIGGGSLTVPYLNWHNIALKKAIGTSAAVGFPLAIVGTLGYMINGIQTTTGEPFTLGFVNLLAVTCISMVSFFTAPLGVSFTQRLPVTLLKKIFSILLILLSIKMLSSVI